MLRAVPFLAVLPLVIVWFGVGEVGKIFLVSLGVMFPIYINTVSGIRQVDPKLIELGRVTGLSTSKLIRRIVLPGALPSVLAGVRYAHGSRWSLPRRSRPRAASAFWRWTPANSCGPM
jgi:sulfonate transport system permease protein